jgi:hypothetical protein
MEIFRRLGERVDRAWGERNYDEQIFPELCVEHLESDPDLDTVPPLDILAWLAGRSALPAQHEIASSFGDVSLTFYDAPRFHVGALVWLDGTTAIHQHAFSGAFKILSGSSLQSVYRFDETRSVNRRFRLGSLTHESAEVLATGSVHAIPCGESFIHSLFHLDRPSLTLIIRTKHEPGTGPQWSYLAPGIAYDPFWADPVANRKLEAVSALLTLPAQEADPVLCEMLRGADLQVTHRLLESLFWRLSSDPLERAVGVDTSARRFAKLADQARERHGSAIDDFLSAYEEAKRQREIIGLRGSLTNSRLRYFLALLLNLPSTESVLEVLSHSHEGHDPVDTFLDLVGELRSTRVHGATTNVLGIPDFDEEHLVVLGAFLRGASTSEAAEALVDALPDEEASEARAFAAEIVESLAASSVLGRLVPVAPSAAAEHPEERAEHA